MADKMPLIGFRVTEAFRKRIEDERVRRDLSVQDMIRYALEIYFKTPLKWDYATTVYSELGASRKEKQERAAWADLWLRYMNEMPRTKTEFLVEVMKLDLLHYRSSRRKSTKRQQAKNEVAEE